MTDREYILKNCTYKAHGLQGPEVAFTAADDYLYTCCDCSGRTLKACKGELTETLIRTVLKNAIEHPIQPVAK